MQVNKENIRDFFRREDLKFYQLSNLTDGDIKNFVGWLSNKGIKNLLKSRIKKGLNPIFGEDGKEFTLILGTFAGRKTMSVNKDNKQNKNDIYYADGRNPFRLILSFIFKDITGFAIKFYIGKNKIEKAWNLIQSFCTKHKLIIWDAIDVSYCPENSSLDKDRYALIKTNISKLEKFYMNREIKIKNIYTNGTLQYYGNFDGSDEVKKNFSKENSLCENIKECIGTTAKGKSYYDKLSYWMSKFKKNDIKGCYDALYKKIDAQKSLSGIVDNQDYNEFKKWSKERLKRFSNNNE